MTSANLNGLDFDKVKELRKSIRSSEEAAHPVYSARLKWVHGLKSTVTVAGGKEIVVDEPDPIGGTDVAPSPEDYLLAAVASCHAVAWVITLTGKGIALRSLEIDIGGPVNFRGAYGIDPTPPGFEDLTINIRIDADADEQTIRDLLPQVRALSVIPDTVARAVPLTFTLA